MDKPQSSFVNRRSTKSSREALLFCGLSVALLAFLFRDALLYGHVLGQADYLFGFLPWETYRPPGRRVGNPLMGDIPTVFFPFLLHARTAILSGDFPLWSSAIGGGQPFFAAFQSAVLSPFSAIAYVLPFPAGLTAVAAARLLVGGVGMYCFLRALPLCSSAAIVGGTAYLLNPFSVVWLEHPLSAVAAWLPWLLLGVELTMTRGGRRTLAGFAAIVMVALLSGHPETAFKVSLLVGAYAIYRGPASGRPLRSVALVAAAGALGALLASIQLLPFLEYVASSRVLADRAASRPLFTNPPASFVTAFVPDFYGTPLGRRFVLEGTNYCEQQIYAGMATWVFAALALLHRRLRGRALFFLAAGTVSALVMYGTVVTRAAVLLVPPLGVAALSRFGLVAIAGLTIAAAIGADALFSSCEQDTDRRPRLLAIAATLAAVIIAAVVLPFLVVHRDWLIGARQWPLTIRATGWAALLLAAAVTVVWVAPMMRRSAVATLTVTLLAVDLLAFADGFHPMIPAEQAFPAVAELEIPRQDAGVFRVAGWQDTLLPNTALTYGLHDFRSYDGIGVAAYSSLLDVGFHFNGSSHELVHVATPHLIDLLNVKYILTPEEVELPADRFELLREGRTRLFRNLRVQPRAFLADEHVVLGGGDALRAMRSGKVDLGRVAVLDRPVEPAQQPERARDSAGVAIVQRYADHAVAIETRADGRRLLVLTDVFYPGWVATVDGLEVPILRADYPCRPVSTAWSSSTGPRRSGTARPCPPPDSSCSGCSWRHEQHGQHQPRTTPTTFATDNTYNTDSISST
jgi:Bacterial membrane protein YfhO